MALRIPRAADYLRTRPAFFVCDIQEAFVPRIYKWDRMVRNSRMMIEAAKVFKAPIVVTEQYTKAFGHTVPELGPLEPSDTLMKFEKTKFSMVNEQLLDQLKTWNCNSVVLFGIEAHVCITQTALDLRQAGLDVYLVCDAVSSQRKSDRDIAFKRLKENGVDVVSSQMMLFEVMQDAKYENFKDISKLVIKNMAEAAEAADTPSA